MSLEFACSFIGILLVGLRVDSHMILFMYGTRGSMRAWTFYIMQSRQHR